MAGQIRQRFTDRVVIVTGASSGIGRAAALRFAREGARVVLAARNSKPLQEIAGTDNSLLAVAADVNKRPEVDQLVTQTIDRFGRVDILVNNAGTGLIAPFDSIQIADAITLFDTNFFGALNCIQAVVPHMKRQGRGQIINVASVAGLRGIPNSSIYSASKAALIALGDALRIELSSTGITVSTICPGRVRLADTRFFETAKKYGPVDLYKSDELSADTVADAILDAAHRRRRLVILPFHARLMYLLNKFSPRTLDRILYKNMPRLDPVAH